MAAYAAYRDELFVGRDVIELGAGMSGAAGIVVWLCCKPKSVLLTDGNVSSCRNISAILERNGFKKEDGIASRQLLWSDVHPDLIGRFDVAICADGVFFKDYRQNLLDCIWKVLRPGGRAFILAPERKGSLKEFIQLAKTKFTVKTPYEYAPKLSQRREDLKYESRFDEDEHYPNLIDMTKDDDEQKSYEENSSEEVTEEGENS